MTERQYTDEQLRSVRRILGESDFYKILGLGKDASEADIKRAYRKVIAC